MTYVNTDTTLVENAVPCMIDSGRIREISSLQKEGGKLSWSDWGWGRGSSCQTRSRSVWVSVWGHCPCCCS